MTSVILLLVVAIAATWLIAYTLLELMARSDEKHRQYQEDLDRFRLMLERGPKT